MRDEHGDVLVFLPGAREIRRVQAGLLRRGRRGVCRCSAICAAERRMWRSAAVAGARKVVLATDIAETSLTIPGLRVVVDSGLARRARFDPVTGMSRLATSASRALRPISAGTRRTSSRPAWVPRLERRRAASLGGVTPPEIRRRGSCAAGAELASWGARDAASCALDEPPPAMLASARDLLHALGALRGAGTITAHGRELARVAVHPRLAHMLLRARELGELPLAANLAALLSMRDLLRGGAGARDADVRARLEVLHGEGAAGGDRGALQRSRQARDLLRRLQPPARGGSRAADARQREQRDERQRRSHARLRLSGSDRPPA